MCSLQPRLWRLSVQLRCLHKMTACASQSQTAATVPQDPALDALVCGSLSSRAFASSSSSPPSSPELEASPQIPLSAFESKQTKTTSLVGQIDRHNGVTVDVSYLPVNLGPGEFSRLLRESLDVWRAEDRAAIWLRLPLERSQLIQCAAAEGFLFHHAEGSEATMSLWLRTDKEDMTPTFATHQLGVSGIVVREDTNEVLVVQDKNRPHSLWKFPGGLAELGEDIDSTAVREVFEETGVETEFQSILAFRQQHQQPGAFGRSDFYVLARLRPLTFELKPCAEEIRQCRWMTVQDLRAQMNKSTLTVRLSDIVLRGMSEGFDQVDIGMEQHKSIYRGMTFKMFFRPLGDQSSVLPS